MGGQMRENFGSEDRNMTEHQTKMKGKKSQMNVRNDMSVAFCFLLAILSEIVTLVD
jgi:hypothetical protein